MESNNLSNLSKIVGFFLNKLSHVSKFAPYFELFKSHIKPKMMKKVVIIRQNVPFGIEFTESSQFQNI